MALELVIAVSALTVGVAAGVGIGYYFGLRHGRVRSGDFSDEHGWHSAHPAPSSPGPAPPPQLGPPSSSTLSGVGTGGSGPAPVSAWSSPSGTASAQIGAAAGDSRAIPSGSGGIPLQLRMHRHDARDGPGDSLEDAEAVAVAIDDDHEARNQRDFLEAAKQLSSEELREFVQEYIFTELASIRKMPAEQRGQAFRTLCADWHPDKCPAIAELATEVFQQLQEQKTKILQ